MKKPVRFGLASAALGIALVQAGCGEKVCFMGLGECVYANVQPNTATGVSGFAFSFDTDKILPAGKVKPSGTLTIKLSGGPLSYRDVNVTSGSGTLTKLGDNSYTFTAGATREIVKIQATDANSNITYAAILVQD